jgi:hypothetical protein
MPEGLISAKDLLKGKITPEDLPGKYIFLYSGFTTKPYPQLIEALNLLTKFGWRVLGYGEGVILLEQVE